MVKVTTTIEAGAYEWTCDDNGDWHPNWTDRGSRRTNWPNTPNVQLALNVLLDEIAKEHGT